MEDSKDEDATVKAALDGDPGYSFQNYNSHPTNADRVTTQSGTLPPDYSGPSTGDYCCIVDPEEGVMYRRKCSSLK